MLNEKQEAFREHIVNLSKKIAPQYGVDWRLMAATAILETGWGQSTLAREAHNLFGIKATKSTQEEDVFILHPRNRVGAINDNPRSVQCEEEPKRFRFFRNEDDSCHAYGRLMSRSSHYAQAREAALLKFIEIMAPIYCPDDDYGEKVLRLVKAFDE